MPKIFFEKLNEAICDISRPPSPSIHSRPQWWKSMPKYSNNVSQTIPENLVHTHRSTARNCPAINDAFNFGYTIYLPYDVFIDSTDKNEIKFFAPKINIPAFDNSEIIMANEEFQMEGFNVPEGYHKVSLKISSLWGIKTESGYSCWITSPVYQYDIPFKMFDTVVDTDKWPQRFPYTFFIKEGFSGTIHAGTPLLQVIPFKRENFESEVVKLDSEDVKRLSQISVSRFSNVYKKLFWTRKKFI